MLVMKWTKDNFRVCWEKCLSVSSNAEREHSDILVLKSEFNTAWNYFSAHELGDVILGYWRTWFNQADTNHFDTQNGHGQGQCWMRGSGNRTTHKMGSENGHGQGVLDARVRKWSYALSERLKWTWMRSVLHGTGKRIGTDKVSVGCEVTKLHYAHSEKQKWTWTRSVLDARVRERNYALSER